MSDIIIVNHVTLGSKQGDFTVHSSGGTLLHGGTVWEGSRPLRSLPGLPPAPPHQVAAGCRRMLVTGSPRGSRIWTLVSGVGTAVAPGR